MEQLRQLLQEILNEYLIDMIVSGSLDKDNKVGKIKVRPVKIGENLYMQLTSYVGTQVFHENIRSDAAVLRVCDLIWGKYKQIQLQTVSEQISVLMSKKGQVTIKRRKAAAKGQAVNPSGTPLAAPDLDHDRKKKYILEEGRPVPFLVELGVMTPQGQVAKRRYDKFKQINRYLEFIEDILPELPKNRKLNIIDFGCGKSYLTFAMYYYLKVLQGYDIHITGLDLKKDVIQNCNDLSRRCGYDDLEFLHGDIADFEGADAVDMVVTLHACDTATDYALYKAVCWQAKVILSVPCCQHELNRQIRSEEMQGMFKYGLIQERFAALATDSMRALLLESVGYKTQILEFIDMEHTPKNILIRAVCKNKPVSCHLSESYLNLKQLIHGEPALEKLLMTMNEKKIRIRSSKDN